MIVSIN